MRGQASGEPTGGGSEDRDPVALLVGRHGLVIRAVVSLTVIFLAFGFVLPGLIDTRDVVGHLGRLRGWDLLWLGMAAVFNAATDLLVLHIALPGISWGRAFVAVNTSTMFANTVPGGDAIGAAAQAQMCRLWGFSYPEIARMVAVVLVWNGVPKVLLPAVALGLLSLTGDAPALVVRVAFFAVGFGILVMGLLVLTLANENVAERLGALLDSTLARVRGDSEQGRTPVTDALVASRAQILDLVVRRWKALTGVGFVDQGAIFAVLFVSLRSLGVGADQIPVLQMLGVFAVVRVASMFPITPGGIGIMEIGFVGGLRQLATGPVELDRIAAAVAVFRAITWGLPILLGVGSAAWYWGIERRRVPRPGSGVV